MASHTRTISSSSLSSIPYQLDEALVSTSPTRLDDNALFSSSTQTSSFVEHSVPNSARLPVSVSFPHEKPMPTRSLSETTSSTTSGAPTIRSPPRGGSSQTKRHSMRLSPPQTPVANGPSMTLPPSSSSTSASTFDRPKPRSMSSHTTNLNATPTPSLTSNNNNSTTTASSTLNSSSARPQSPAMTTPPSIHKSIHALDAKSITLNMEKSTQHMRAAVASVAAAAAAAANAKYHTNSSSEEFHITSPTSPTYSHHNLHHHHHSTYHHPAASTSSYFAGANASSSSSSAGYHHHPYHHHHHHSNAVNVPLPTTPLSNPLHPYHRQGSISSITHSTGPAQSVIMNNSSSSGNNSSINNSNANSSSNNNNGNNGGGGYDDIWQTLCVRVLPLFNGEGVQGTIEDLNDLLRRCLSDPISPQLYHDVESLLHDGMFTLNAKMFGVTDEKLLDRLVEQWSFFFTYALPYFEAVFLPLRTDVRYRSRDEAEMWNVRNMALQSFRDNVILLQIKRLEDVFNKLFTDFGSSQNPAATAAKMLQMTSLLASAPDHNEEMDRVLSNLKANWKIMMNKGDRRGFAGVRKARSGPTLNDKIFG